MVNHPRTKGWGWLAALLLSAGCAGHDAGGMVAIAPPHDWSDRLATSRDNKDQSFRDPQASPLLPERIESFEGLDYWEPEATYYLVGPLHLFAEPEPFVIPMTAGEAWPCQRVGWVQFSLGGQLRHLQVYRMADEQKSFDDVPLFVPFKDATAGSDTYPGGRYLELQGRPGGPYVLDFNRAYNPYCAYGGPYGCPLTPAENRLTLRIEAGERGYEKAEP